MRFFAPTLLGLIASASAIAVASSGTATAVAPGSNALVHPEVENSGTAERGMPPLPKKPKKKKAKKSRSVPALKPVKPATKDAEKPDDKPATTSAGKPKSTDDEGKSLGDDKKKR